MTNKYETLINDLTREDFITLLELSMKSNLIQSNGKIYAQLKGLSMGNNLSGTLAIIYMNYIECQIIRKIELNNVHILFWKRYIDDIFYILSASPTITLINISNSISSDIQFTITI